MGALRKYCLLMPTEDCEIEFTAKPTGEPDFLRPEPPSGVMTVKRQGGTELEMVFPAHFLTVSPNGIKHIPPMLDGEVVSYCSPVSITLLP